MSRRMNRKEWLKSTGTLVAGGLGLSSLSAPLLKGLIPVETKQPFQMVNPSRRFISDEEFGRQVFPTDLNARLFANENPFGPSPNAKQAIENSIDGSYRYAVREIGTLAGKISEHENITPEQLLISAGSTPLLLAAALYFYQHGTIITGEPSYADLPDSVEALGGDVQWIPLDDQYKLDLDAMETAIDQNTSLVYICNPNNPTGTVLEYDVLESFCKRVSQRVPIFIDEAYIDYLDEPDQNSMIRLVTQGYDVMIARTFSKLYGFAGLRVGYLAASEKWIETLLPYTPGPFSVSSLSLAAAEATYLEEEYMAEVKSKTFESREFLLQTLSQEGYSPIPSAANFVMFPIIMDGERFILEMMKRSVGVRAWAFEGKHWCRVSIGTMDEMEYFAEAFKQIS